MAIRATSTVTAELAIAVRTPLWARWLKIAVEHERAAIGARRELESRTEQVRATGSGWDMTLELEPAMIAISAAAHAIDGLYGDVDEHIEIPQSLRDQWRQNRTRRPARILETLKRGFKLGLRTRSWPSELEWLFDLRDGALHHGPKFSATVPHPLGTNAAPEYVSYAHENATRAVDLAIDVIGHCMDHPKLAALEDWAAQHRPILEQQTSRRGR